MVHRLGVEPSGPGPGAVAAGIGQGHPAVDEQVVQAPSVYVHDGQAATVLVHLGRLHGHLLRLADLTRHPVPDGAPGVLRLPCDLGRVQTSQAQVHVAVGIEPQVQDDAHRVTVIDRGDAAHGVDIRGRCRHGELRVIARLV